MQILNFIGKNYSGKLLKLAQWWQNYCKNKRKSTIKSKCTHKYKVHTTV